jgi:hypothetical protein
LDARDQAGGPETIEGGVVLRFPGDWVGPLDELIPFGPSADREPSPTTSEPDFWGEDSAALQDAVEAPQPSAPPLPRPARVRHPLAAGAVVAAVLLGIAAVLGSQSSSAPHVRGVTFEIASVPPLASGRPRSAGPRSAGRPIHRAKHRVSTTVPHAGRVSSTPARSSSSTSSSVVTTPTSSPSHQPTSSSPSSTASGVSQSGGAFTLGGP